MRSRPRPRVLVPALLTVALLGCAAPTFEERLSHLGLLKSRGTITEDEYAIMRRRLVETADTATLRAPDAAPAARAEPEEPPQPLSTEWVIGAWRATYAEGGPHAYVTNVETVVEFSQDANGLEWRLTRQFRYFGCGLSVAEASGSAVVRDDGLEMTGSYLNGRCMVSEGLSVEFRLRRVGQSLEAVSVGADPLTPTLVLHRIQP